MVCECHDLNFADGNDAIENGIGESRQAYAANTAWMDQFPGIGSALSQTDHALKLFDECRS